MTAPALTRRSAAVAVVVGVALLAGCGRAAPDLGARAAGRLQADVLAVSQASAAGDLVGARARLTTLTDDVAAARTAGQLSAQRKRAIDASVVLVAADLSVLQRQAADARAAMVAADKAAADKAAADKAASQRDGRARDSGKKENKD
jgi:hypothetical protein